jgi:iron complex outermembrane recepter protein
LQLSADWYDIKLSSAIGQPGLQRVVDTCFESGVWCEYVERSWDEARQAEIVGRVWNPFLNIDAARVRGADIEAAYRITPNLFADRNENLVIRALAGYQRENSSTPLDAPTADFAGVLGRPKWSATGTITYNVGPVSMRWQQRYIDSQIQTRTWVEGVDVDNNRVPSATFTNVRLGYTHDTDQGSWTASLNINNLFDRDPPIIPSFGQRGVGAQTSNSMFDLLGRRYTAGLRYRY